MVFSTARLTRMRQSEPWDGSNDQNDQFDRSKRSKAGFTPLNSVSEFREFGLSHAPGATEKGCKVIPFANSPDFLFVELITAAAKGDSGYHTMGSSFWFPRHTGCGGADRRK